MDKYEIPENDAPRRVNRVKLNTILTYINIALSIILVALIAFVIILEYTRSEEPTIPTTVPTVTTGPTTAPTTQPSTEPTTDPTTEPVIEKEMLPNLAELYNQNPDIVGWIKIDGTVVDYPVMHTPDDPEEYLRKNFNGLFDLNGLPFINANCSMNPESDNLIIYGHNMRNGAMFRTLLSYAEEEFWEEHPLVHLSTLYDERTYEILAAFYDRIYYTSDDCFKFYQFIDARDEDHFNEAITYYHANALYDTGVTAEYGERLITLVTCSYHHEKGRFVVVAREIVDEDPVDEIPQENQ